MTRLWGIALGLAIVSFIYYELTTLIDLYPFNNVRGSTPSERSTEAVINGIPLLVAAILIALSAIPVVKWLAFVAAAVVGILAIMGLLLWWLPYVADVTVPWATVPGTTWAELHARTYAETIIVVPPIGNRPRPNLEHMILHALFLGTAGVALASALERVKA